MKHRSIIFLISVFMLTVIGFEARGAEILFENTSQELGLGGVFETEVFLNTESGVINAFEGEVVYDSSLLELVFVEDGGTIVNIWIERPKKSAERVRFAGMIPGGYNGGRGYLFSLVFQARAPGKTTLGIENGKAFLHDGIGSETNFKHSSFVVTVSEEQGRDTTDSVVDSDPPEPFIPEVSRDKNIFDGKWFVAFATQDKGSGIDHYEIQETRSEEPSEDGWIVAESPYALTDQTRKSALYVRAVDNRGNQQITRIFNRYPSILYENILIWSILLAVLLMTYALWKFFHKRKKR